MVLLLLGVNPTTVDKYIMSYTCMFTIHVTMFAVTQAA